MKKTIICISLLFVFTEIFAQTGLLVNVYNRDKTSLNGQWNYIVDPYENGYYNYRSEPYDQMTNPGKGAYFLDSKQIDKSELLEYNFDRSPVLKVPGDWNTQADKLFYYEGTIWYRRTFNYTKKKESNRVFLYFDAVNYQAEVYLNGSKLGIHTGGFTPFNFEITSLLRDRGNSIVVKVDNKRKKEAVPTLNTDWWNYGGITRDVSIVEVPGTFIEDYVIQLNPQNPQQLSGYVKLNGSNTAKKEIEISIPELHLSKKIITDDAGTAALIADVKDLKYWSPEIPKLYKLTISSQADHFTDQVGFRTIKTGGSHILLNDKRVFLRGICIHEESPFKGSRATTMKEARQLLSWAKELGCNYVRLAHYPHNEYMVRAAEEMGILVWEEIPVYWTISWENEATYNNASNQLNEVISRDKNRAAVIIWSVANETPATQPRNNFLGKLARQARKSDPTRLISAALEQSNYQGDHSVKTISDPFADSIDILSFNEYIGWYDGLPSKCSEVSWKITQDKPVVISEFGADAKYGYHADSLTRWSEEYQAYLYVQTLAMLSKIDQLQGMSPWILKDFRSPRRPLPGIQDGWNRKGLYSDKGEKKKAFFVLLSFYKKKVD